MTADVPRVGWHHVATVLCAAHLACAASASRDTLLGHVRLSTLAQGGPRDGYESSSITNITVDHIRQCAHEVRGVVDRWVHEQGLSPLKDQRTNTGFLFQVRAARLADRGFFQVTYDVYNHGASAEVSFWFVDLAGRVHDPGDFVELGTTAVIGALSKAARC